MDRLDAGEQDLRANVAARQPGGVDAGRRLRPGAQHRHEVLLDQLLHVREDQHAGVAIGGDHAVEKTVEASSPTGDRKVGVIWHTQGSGKSLLMAFYSGQLVRRPELENPTIVVITDRNDLDDQLFGTFSMCRDLIRQTPIQAESRDDLRAALSRASGGVIFTTIQKFSPAVGEVTYPTLSDRRNIVVIADEAHRSQYGLNRPGFAGG